METQQSNSNTGTGYLLVRVSTARGAIPVVGAVVTVREHTKGESAVKRSDPDKGMILSVQTTNRDGLTDPIALPTPPKSGSLSPYDQNDAFSTFNIQVDADGYYPVYFSNVPVYDTITSIQPVVLIPVPENGNPDGKTEEEGFFYESTNPDL